MRPTSRRLLSTLLAVVATGALAQAPPTPAPAPEAIDAKVIAWRRDFHQHPELGNRELRTAKIVAEHLRKLGLEVRTGVAHTGVVAILRGGKPGPRIALRADMDALPVTERPGPAVRLEGHHAVQAARPSASCTPAATTRHSAILMGVAEHWR